MDVVIAGIVHRGVVSHAELLQAGITRDEIKHRVRRKRLHIQWTGVYLVGHPDPPPFGLEFAALKVGGDESHLFYRTAAVLYGLLPEQVDPTIHLALNAQRRDRKGLKFHRIDLPPTEVRTIHGDLRITTPARTLLDNADHPRARRRCARCSTPVRGGARRSSSDR